MTRWPYRFKCALCDSHAVRGSEKDVHGRGRGRFHGDGFWCTACHRKWPRAWDKRTERYVTLSEYRGIKFGR